MSGPAWDRLIVTALVAFLAGFATFLLASEKLDAVSDRQAAHLDSIRHRAVTVSPPTRATDCTAALHAAQEAESSLGAVVDRLEQQTWDYDWEEASE